MIIYNVRKYRRLKDLTQEQLAKLVDVRRETIIRMEQGKYSPSIDLAYKVSKALNCDINVIFEYIEDTHEEQADEDPKEQAAADTPESIIKQYTAIMFKKGTFSEFRELASTEVIELFDKWAIDNVNKQWKLQDITQEIFKSFISWCDME